MTQRRNTTSIDHKAFSSQTHAEEELKLFLEHRSKQLKDADYIATVQPRADNGFFIAVYPKHLRNHSRIDDARMRIVVDGYCAWRKTKAIELYTSEDKH